MLIIPRLFYNFNYYLKWHKMTTLQMIDYSTFINFLNIIILGNIVNLSDHALYKNGALLLYNL